MSVAVRFVLRLSSCISPSISPYVSPSILSGFFFLHFCLAFLARIVAVRRLCENAITYHLEHTYKPPRLPSSAATELPYFSAALHTRFLTVRQTTTCARLPPLFGSSPICFHFGSLNLCNFGRDLSPFMETLPQ